MARSFKDTKIQVANSETVIFGNRISIFKVQRSAVINLGAAVSRQVERTDDIVFITMGFKYMGNLCPVLGSYIQIYMSISSRIDYRCFVSISHNV